MSKETEVAKREETALSVPDEHAGVGMPELDQEDKAGQRRWYCLNVSTHPITRKVHDATHFFDTESEKSKEMVNCVFLGLSYSKRLYYYDGEKNVTLCTSLDMRDGAPDEGFTWESDKHESKPMGKGKIPWSKVTGVTEEEFKEGVIRPCAACKLAMDGYMGRTRIRPPCKKEYNFLGYDLDDGKFFIFRCRGGTAWMASSFVGKHNTGKDMLPIYHYHVNLTAVMAKNGKYAQPVFTIVNGTKEKSAWSSEELEEWRYMAIEVGAEVLESSKGEEAEIVGGENGEVSDDKPAF